MIDSLLEIRVRSEYSAMMQYVSSHITFAFDRQLLLADLVGDLPWAYDLNTGTLSFGDRFQWQAEVLGTESEESNTWLWAWANEGSRIPAGQVVGSAVRTVERLFESLFNARTEPEHFDSYHQKDFVDETHCSPIHDHVERRATSGLEYRSAQRTLLAVAELSARLVPLDRADGQTCASLAVGEGCGQAYYRSPYEGGAAYLLLTNDSLPLEVEDPLRRILVAR